MAMLPALTDMKAQLGRLVDDGFVAEAGPARWPATRSTCAR